MVVHCTRPGILPSEALTLTSKLLEPLFIYLCHPSSAFYSSCLASTAFNTFLIFQTPATNLSPIAHQSSQTRFVSRGSLATMSSHDPSRFDDSEDEEDFNPAPADISDEEQDGDDKKIKRGSSPAPRDDDDDEDERPSKSRHADDDDEEEEEEEEDNPKRRDDDDDDEEDEEDDEDEDDVQQVSRL
jgi:hypothetical protein